MSIESLAIAAVEAIFPSLRESRRLRKEVAEARAPLRAAIDRTERLTRKDPRIASALDHKKEPSHA